MTGKIRIAILVAIVAVVVAVAAVAINTNNNQQTDEELPPSVHVGVNVDGNDKIVLVAGEGEYFKESMSKNDLQVYYIVLDSYIDENYMFDAKKYYQDLTEEFYDENLGEYLPSFTKKITDFQVSAVDSKNVLVSFSAPGEYAAYIIGFKDTGLKGLSSFPVSKFDIPNPVFVDNTPVISVTNDIFENTEDISITLEAENTKFTSISEEDIYLAGCFDSLTVKGVTKIDDYTIEIQTTGVLYGSTAYLGYVYVSAGAVDCGYDLVATVLMTSTFVAVDEGSLKISDSAITFDILVSDSIYNAYGGILLNDKAYYFASATPAKQEGFWSISASLPTPFDTVYDSIDLLNSVSIKTIDPKEDNLECEFDICILGAVISAGSSSYSYTFEDEIVFEITLSALRGYIKDISIDDLVLDCTNKEASITYADNERIEITVPGFVGPTFNASITVKHGVMNPWGIEESDVVLDIMTCIDVGNDLSVEEMVKMIYSSMNFMNIFGGIALALGGIDMVVSVLGGIGVINTASASEIQIGMILANTEQIKLMLADQAKVLNEMNLKLDQIKEELKEAKLREYSNYYSELILQNNRLSNAINDYSSKIKSETWDMITGKYDGQTMYFYITEDGKISIMPGSLFTKYSSGNTIDGKGILPEYTFEVPIVSGVTFKDANDGKGYSKDTEAKMIACLKKAIEEKYSEFYFVELKNGKKITYPSSTLAKEAFYGLTVKFAQDLAKDKYGYDILKEYYLYTEKLASLEVDAQGNVIINTFLFKSNPTLASQYILQSNYNFESEARANLVTMNDCITLRLFQYTLMARQIEQLQGSGSDSIEKHYNKAVEFLKSHRGYRTDITKDKPGYEEYCYVSNSYIKQKGITIQAKATVSFKNARSLTEPPTVDIGVMSAAQLGVPKSYINEDQFKKFYSNYERLNSSAKEKVSFEQYIKKNFGSYHRTTQLITKFDAGEYFDDARGVTLYSYENITEHHWDPLLGSGKDYLIRGTVDISQEIFKAYSSDVYNKVAYLGKVFNTKECKYVSVKTEQGSLIFAAGFYVDHVNVWKYDEGAILTPANGIRSHMDRDNTNADSNRYSKSYTVYAYYVMLETYCK